MADTDYRVERDSMGETRVPAGALWGAQTQRAIQNFPISGLAHAARLHPGARARQMGRGRGQPRARRSRPGPGFRHPARSTGGGRGSPRRPFPDRRLPDGFGHQQQHECQRGHRATRHRVRRWLDRARPRERSRQPRAKQQRRDPDGDPRRCRACAVRIAAARAQGTHRDDLAQGCRRRRNRQDRAHAPDGCDAGHARTGDGCVADPARGRRDATAGLPAATACAGAGRHGRGYGHQRQSAICTEGGGFAVAGNRSRLAPRARFLRRARVAGHGGRAVGTPAHARGRADEDCQRLALDEQRPARGARGNLRCPRCSRAAASCRARSIPSCRKRSRWWLPR